MNPLWDFVACKKDVHDWLKSTSRWLYDYLPKRARLIVFSRVN